MFDLDRQILANQINNNPGTKEELESEFGQIWDTQQLQKDFKVLQFRAPFVIVKRRSDGVLGTLFFQHAPRYYWGWDENNG
jgi:hypothetical protein